MPVTVLAGCLVGRTGQHIAYLLVEVIGPGQVIDGGVDSPPKVLKNHGEYVCRCELLKRKNQNKTVVVYDFAMEEG
jgi:hypothetical protein